MSRSNEKVLSYQDVLLRRADVELLRESEWLNDQIIAFYLEYLSQERLQGRPGVLFLPPTVAFLICNALSPAELMPMLEPLKIPQRKVVLLPVNDNTSVERAEGGTHWSALVCCPEAAACIHFDSAAGSNRSAAQRLCRAVGPLLGLPPSSAPSSPSRGPGALPRSHLALSLPGRRLAGAPRLVEARMAQQRNSHDCGVYTIAVAEAIAGTPDLESRSADGVREALERFPFPEPAGMRRGVRDLVARLAARQGRAPGAEEQPE
uniref:Nedd8-specific protease 1-like n=1 Tax=Tetraselmis sp. GSL018 TaxID=582737 RepID=A0A061QKN6_9CHLO|eukprot:CAMPEP_0177620474 /NCGR_PEP_ID=MMETSP0419_2-20121207/26930_1 /TAXON_ID=582737 /ORGANISM="Tetraselmis sp., Strain GSL018" /LENGTH=262 /DNA_ID=CAMNT_0019120045 /DNA_START=133 /DNA_END=921 /DNA_ORIENTATION=+